MKLASNDTPLLSGQPLTVRELSWLGAILSVGALLGSLCFGYIISLVGTKRAVLFLSVPCLVFWLLIYFGNRYYHIFIGEYQLLNFCDFMGRKFHHYLFAFPMVSPFYWWMDRRRYSVNSRSIRFGKYFMMFNTVCLFCVFFHFHFPLSHVIGNFRRSVNIYDFYSLYAFQAM